MHALERVEQMNKQNKQAKKKDEDNVHAEKIMEETMVHSERNHGRKQTHMEKCRECWPESCKAEESFNIKCSYVSKYYI